MAQDSDIERRLVESAVESIYLAAGGPVALPVPDGWKRERESWIAEVTAAWKVQFVQILVRRGDASDVRPWVG